MAQPEEVFPCGELPLAPQREGLLRPQAPDRGELKTIALPDTNNAQDDRDGAAALLDGAELIPDGIIVQQPARLQDGVDEIHQRCEPRVAFDDDLVLQGRLLLLRPAQGSRKGSDQQAQGHKPRRPIRSAAEHWRFLLWPSWARILSV